MEHAKLMESCRVKNLTSKSAESAGFFRFLRKKKLIDADSMTPLDL
jgi:hypothetical protein